MMREEPTIVGVSFLTALLDGDEDVALEVLGDPVDTVFILGYWLLDELRARTSETPELVLRRTALRLAASQLASTIRQPQENP